ncbi:MAG: 23S rRNA (guanosine(2251)-2'-O)-methyltransferase RlmB [Candidatus Margulisiibacteriota bacterium]
MNILEGKNPILEALRAGRPINRILISSSFRRDPKIDEIITLAKNKGIVIEWVERKLIDAKSNSQSPQGIMAYAAPKDYVEVDDIIAAAKQKGEIPFLLILDGIEDPYNLGAIIRSADAFGVHGIIIPKRRAAPLTEIVAKASAGAIEYVPVARVTNLTYTIQDLKKELFTIVGAEEDGEKLVTEVKIEGPRALVIGGEGGGISRLVKENCDYLIKIPMRGKINSLNASVSAAICMFALTNLQPPF